MSGYSVNEQKDKVKNEGISLWCGGVASVPSLSYPQKEFGKFPDNAGL